MATYRKPLKDRDGNTIIPAMTSDETGWVKTADISDGAVTGAKLDYSSARASFFTAKGATAVPANADLNTATYVNTGRYYCPLTATGQTITNNPIRGAFYMDVTDMFNDKTSPSGWVYFRREIHGLDKKSYVSDVTYNGTTLTFGEWRRLCDYTTRNFTLASGLSWTTDANTIYKVGDVLLAVLSFEGFSASANSMTYIGSLPSDCKPSENSVFTGMTNNMQNLLGYVNTAGSVYLKCGVAVSNASVRISTVISLI